MSAPRFAVLGAGAGGLAMAGHLALSGCEVVLFNRTAEHIAAIKKQGGIRLTEEVQGMGKLAHVTSDIGRAIAQADVLVVIVPAFAHVDLAKACGPHLRDGQTVILMPGRTGGAIEFARTLKARGVKRSVAIAETQTTLHTCRLSLHEAEVVVFAVKQHVPVAALLRSDTERIVAQLSPLFPQFVAAESVMHTSMGNVGAILHPAPTLFNVGWIETLQTEFLHYYEGITQSVAGFLEKMDDERLAVAQAMGVDTPSVKRWLTSAYMSSQGDTLYDAIQSNEAYREIYAPETIHHRYVYDDVPTGLVPIASLGKLVGVGTPRMDLIIELAHLLCGRDFRAHGRTAASLGLAGMGREGLQRLVREGNGL